jgi:hypothetical protein
MSIEPGSAAPTVVYRYWGLVDRDWISVPAHGNQPTRAQLEGWGYQTFTTPQFYVSLIGNSTMVANFRWWHAGDQDWVDIPEGSISDATMTGNGYTNKTFQYYAFPTQRAGTTAIYRWWHPGDRDWITLRNGEISDATMTANGYQTKTLLFYAFPTAATETGYFNLGTPQSSVVKPATWTESGDHPHTFSVVDVNPTLDPLINQGFRYIGYFGHHNCSGIGIVRSNDLDASTWTQNVTPLFTGTGERWASAQKNANGTINIVHNVYYCTGAPGGLPYYIVGKKSTDGLNGTQFTSAQPIVKESSHTNGNPTLFTDPADNRVYLYWFRDNNGTREIRVKSAATFDGLLSSSPTNVGQLVAYCSDVVASPQVMKVGSTYYLAVETYESQDEWKTRILTSHSPTSGFYEIPGNPFYGNGSACVFQHVFGTELHTYYGHESTDNDESTWTVDHVKASLI